MQKLRNGWFIGNNMHQHVCVAISATVIDIDNTCVKDDNSIKLLVMLGLLVCSCTFSIIL